MDDITVVGTVLHSVQTCTPQFKFPSDVTATKDGSTSFSVFQDVRDVVEEIIFAKDSELNILGSYTFYKCSKIRYVNLSNCLNLTQIKQCCFYSCSSLSSVILPENGSVSSIGDKSFGSTKIVNFHLPKSIKTCGWYIFEYVYTLENVTTVKDVLFSNLWTFTFSLSSLRHFIIPKAIRTLGANSLQKTKIESFEIDPDNPYLTVYEGCVYSNDMCTLYAIPSVMKSIKFHPNCSSLVSRPFMWSTIPEVVIPATVSVFCQQCFYLSTVKNVTILNATSIPFEMFFQSSLTNLILPSNLETLGDGFAASTQLRYLFVPKSVSKLDNAFRQCRRDLIVEFEEGSNFSFENGYLYNHNKTRLHSYMGSDTSIEIIESIEVIDGSVFNGRSEITSVVFNGTNIKTLGSQSFYSTKGLSSIYLPSSLRTLGSSCFSNNGLQSVVLPGSVESISQSCFSGCSSLENVTICEGTSSIQLSSFSYCIKLKTVNFPSTLASIKDSSFCNTGLKNIIFGSSISPDMKSVAKLNIKERAFKNCALETITFTSQVSSIGESAFEGCTLLTKVDIIDTSIAELPPLAFASCSNLSSIYLPSLLREIGDRCFEGCGFVRFSVPASVSQLGSRAIGNNKKLVTVSLASNTSLSSIVSTSFKGCSSLREFVFDGKSWTYSSEDGVLINTVERMLCIYPPAHVCGRKICETYEVPEGVRSIGPSAFLNSPLSVIRLHSGVVEIGSRAFDSCQRLTKLIIEAPSLEVGVLSFEGIDFNCGLIECSADVIEQLEEVGVPNGALFPCPTEFSSLFVINYYVGWQVIASNDE